MGFLILDDKEKDKGDVLDVQRIKGVKPLQINKNQ
jgi:hypothetical protein